MMTPSNLHPKLPTKQEIQTTTTKKQATTTANTRPQQAHHHQQTLKCPRCDSPNTKFCYYNNYSLTQPRHFCKTCRRYWTKGGALRNVPIGGGCRKNKKLKASSSSSSRFSGSGDSKEYSTGSSVDFGGGFKLFHGLSPAMDFNLGGLSFPRLNNLSPNGGIYNHFGDQIPSSSAGVNVTSSTPSGFSLDLLSAGSSGTGSGSLLGFHNHPNLSSVTNVFSTGAIQEVGGGGSMVVHTSLASSIESLSSINQDLHWKLQQQRLAMLFGDGGGEDQNKETGSVNGIHIPPPPPQAQKLQPILFQNLEVSSSKPEVSRVGNSRKEGAIGEMATEWFFGNSYGQVAAAATPTNSNSNGNDSAGNWNNGVQASWGDLHQYNSLP